MSVAEQLDNWLQAHNTQSQCQQQTFTKAHH